MAIIDLVRQLPTHPTKEYPRRPITAIQFLVLHHAAGPENQTPFEIARFHVETRKYPGIAYHYLISTAGQVYKVNYATTVSWCVAGQNAKSLCVCLIGNREVNAIPDAQYIAAVDLFRDLREAYGVPIERVKGHREMPNQSTACPGKFIGLNTFRGDVA